MVTPILLRQIIIMALLAAVGIYLCRSGLLTAQGGKDLGAILLRVIIPCLIVKSCLIEFSSKHLLELAASALLAFVGLLLSMGTAYLVFGKRHRLENFATSFCNAGFIGIPLIQAVIGEEGVFYVAGLVALLNLFQQTYGVYLLTGKKDAVSVKTIAKNPVLIAIVIGLLLVVSRVQVPAILVSTLGYIINMNTPVAMILVGTYMAKLPLRKMLDKQAFLCVLLRLVVIPALTLLVFLLLPVGSAGIVMAVYIAAITPVGSNICVFAQQHGCDYTFSVVTVCLSTLLSVITVPLMVSLAQMFL